MSGAPFSADPVSDLRALFAYPFMVHAFEAGTAVALTAGAIGWFMVLRRQSFAGHTLAVVSFPGAAAAVFFGVSVTAGYFAGALVAAVAIALVPGSGAQRGRARESAVIGTVQAFALACGVLFVSLYGGFLDSLTSLLFGSFLGVSSSQVLILAAVTVVSLAVLAGGGRTLLFASVDPDVAAARGVPVRAVSVGFLLLLGAAAAATSQITGSLLVFALLVMPAAAAQRLTVRPGSGVALSVVLALAITWLGLAAAFFSPYPIGFWVSTFGFATFVAAGALQGPVDRWRGRRLLGPRPAAVA
jgi:zinc/manganese transport system permease protein